MVYLYYNDIILTVFLISTSLIGLSLFRQCRESSVIQSCKIHVEYQLLSESVSIVIRSLLSCGLNNNFSLLTKLLIF